MVKFFQKRKNKQSKKMLATGIIAIGLALSVLFSYAANYALLPNRQLFYYGNVVNFRWYNISGAYQNAFSLGLNNWNAAQNHFNWGQVSTTPSGCSDNYITVFSDTNTSLYGLTTTRYNTTTKKDISCKIAMNTNACNGHSAYFFQSVATHELGHGMSLDEYNTVKTVIMSQNRDREHLYTPQSDDVLGVTTAY